MAIMIKIEIHTDQGALIMHETPTIDKAVIWLEKLKEVIEKED